MSLDVCKFLAEPGSRTIFKIVTLLRAILTHPKIVYIVTKSLKKDKNMTVKLEVKFLKRPNLTYLLKSVRLFVFIHVNRFNVQVYSYNNDQAHILTTVNHQTSIWM